jgi:Zn-dependent peptidase ImmA (M78 family)
VGYERFANAFAAEFLLPADALQKLVDELSVWEQDFSDPGVVVHLQRHFGVSYAALLVRLLQTRLISQSKYEELRGFSPTKLAQALGYEVHPADVGNHDLGPLERFPDRMLRLIRAAVARGVMTVGDAAETLDVSRDEVMRLTARPRADTTEWNALSQIDELARS